MSNDSLLRLSRAPQTRSLAKYAAQAHASDVVRIGEPARMIAATQLILVQAVEWLKESCLPSGLRMGYVGVDTSYNHLSFS